jgi:adenylosuccinate synthase
VLNIFETVRVCTHYQLPDGTVTEQLPYDLCDTDVVPIYKDFKGWETSLDGVHTFDKMPAELAAYVTYLETELNLPITFVSTGPDREALVHREEVGV